MKVIPNNCKFCIDKYERGTVIYIHRRAFDDVGVVAAKPSPYVCLDCFKKRVGNKILKKFKKRDH